MLHLLPLATFLAETTSHAAEAAGGHAEEATGIAALGIDPLAILAQAATFLLLFWVIKKFALDKIVATLEERRKTIDKGVRLGYEMAEEKAKLEERIADQLRETREQADKILAEAQQEGAKVLKDAQADAAKKVESMLQDADARIDENMQKARKELEKDMRELVADATEVIIGEKLDAQKDDALIRRALSGAGRE